MSNHVKKISKCHLPKLILRVLSVHKFTSIVSDTIRYSDSPGIIRRFASMLHNSFRSTRPNSDETSSHGSVPQSRKASITGTSPSHSLLRRATSKTAKGSSIIRKDGSIILTKNGKIISVRPDNTAIKRDHSFQGYGGTEKGIENGIPKSKSDINIVKRDGVWVELSPLLPGAVSSPRSSKLSLDYSRPSSTHSSSSKLYHSSLGKIDSVDETEIVNDHKVNELKPPEIRTGISLTKSRPLGKDQELANYDYSNSSLDETKGFNLSKNYLDDTCDVSSPVIINIESDDWVHGSMSQTKLNKSVLKSSKSETVLDQESVIDSQKNAKSKMHASRSYDDVFTVPVLKCPSLERLDRPILYDEMTTRKFIPSYPVYKRRWLPYKSEQEDPTKTKVKQNTVNVHQNGEI